MMLIHVGSKGRVSSLYVSLNCFERHLLCEPIHLICRVRCRPIHGLLERIHRLSGQLDVTFARLTVLQLLDVARLQSETVEIGKLGRIAELSDCEIAGKLAKRINVGSKLEIFFGGRLHIHGAEYKHLIRRARFHYFCNRLSVANRNGKAVAKVMESRTPDEVFVFGSVYVQSTPEKYLKLASDIDALRKLPSYLAIRKF